MDSGPGLGAAREGSANESRKEDLRDRAGQWRDEEGEGEERLLVQPSRLTRPLPCTASPTDCRQDCYLRFCADDYDPNNLDIFLHLSNNSVAKYYEKVRGALKVTRARTVGWPDS